MVTFAVPLADVIAKTPFGRGLRYAVVEGGPDAAASQPNGQLVGSIGVGSTESVGGAFGASDRVFWASDKSYAEATDYEIPIDETAYAIQSDNDRLANYLHWRGSIEKGGPEDQELQELARTVSEREIIQKYGSIVSSGSNQPKLISIRDLEMDESRSALEAVKSGASILQSDQAGTAARQAGLAEPVIERLEKESLAKFADQYVVPLRATRPAFMNKGDNMVNNAYGERVLGDLAPSRLAR
jgi:hypothetical protein